MFLHLQSLNARSRALLMQKLDRSGSATTYAPAKFVLLFLLFYCSLICFLFFSIAGSAVTPAVNSTALPLPTAPLLGAASAVSTLVPPLVQGTVPTHPGQLGTALQVPTASVPIFDTIGVPSECLLLKNMFDPKNEVCGLYFLEVHFLSLYPWSHYNIWSLADIRRVRYGYQRRCWRRMFEVRKIETYFCWEVRLVFKLILQFLV